jgi:hypothetical protein
VAKQKKPYKKYVYWLNAEQVSVLKKVLEEQKIKLKQAKGIVCTPMDRINKIAIVAPEIWNETCARQGSWYRTSEKNGLHLIISSFKLDEFEAQWAAVISESDFVLPQPAAQAEKDLLLADPGLQERMPDRWKQVGETEKRIYLRWGKRLGATIPDYHQLHMTHTANHANFINPRFFLETSEGHHALLHRQECPFMFLLCGAVSGSGFPIQKKLVVPCPGAVIFARLKPDRYLLVEKPPA